MPLPPILTTTAEVVEFAGKLEKEQVIAVDLEADSMHNYQEKVCLLQFSTPETTVLIDPLAAAELTPLKPILSDPAVRKIFHAADYDIRCLARDFDIVINGLFDTMICSQFLGEERFGLADVLKKYLAVELDKRFQRADWSLRPLSGEMIRYAAGDTRHLHELAAILEQKLVDKGRLSWVREEFQLLEGVRFAERSGPEFLRFKGAGRLNRRQLAALENLLHWRDREACRRDCPLYRVLGNKIMLELAQKLPASGRQLSQIETLPPRLRERYGRKLIAEIAAAMSLAEDDLPHYPRSERKERDAAFEKRLNVLKGWRKATAQRLELDPGVLINNAALEEVAQKQPADSADLSGIRTLKNWQREELGDGILRALQTHA